MNWPDLLAIVPKQAGMEVTEETIAQLSTEQKRELLCNNPVTTAQHFSHRFQNFVKHIPKGSGSPIGEVVDYFWRIEFQLRGSPHVHSLWWVKDAPNLQTVEGLRAAPDFIDQYITTRAPSEDSSDDVLRQLVLRVQKQPHAHVARLVPGVAGLTTHRMLAHRHA